MRRVALIGMPNTGKSSLFNRLTGASARVANWPGMTVDILSARLLLGADMVEVADLPGIHDLSGASEDERVSRQVLETLPVDVALVVVNATQIERQLPLVLSVRALGLPMVVLLNMSDEAERFGVRIDRERLSSALGVPVIAVNARNGSGLGEVKRALVTTLRETRAPDPAMIRERLGQTPPGIETSVAALVAEAVSQPVEFSDRMSERLDRFLLHPWAGIPLFLLVMLLGYQLVFALGAPLQDALEQLLEFVRGGLLEPLQGVLPAFAYGLLVEGVFDGVGTVVTFVPIVILFFLFMGMIEDSGYLSRIAFLMDGLMARMGLDGRGFVLMLMGLGCNVPALMGTRVIRSRGLRLLTMMLIPFSLCAARLQVFLFFIAALFMPATAGLVLFSLYLVSLLAAFLTALIFRGRLQGWEPLVLELPPYRLPAVRNVLMRGWIEVRHFLARASVFIVLGVMLIWMLTHYPAGVEVAGPESWAGQLGVLLAPVMEPIGIDPALSVALLFGFVAKEVVLGGLAVIYAVQEDGLGTAIAAQVDWVQAYSFMLFLLLYTPCVSTLATLRAEARSLRFTVGVTLWSLLLAWSVSFLFYQTARWLGA